MSYRGARRVEPRAGATAAQDRPRDGKIRHPRVAPVHRVSAGDRLCWYVTGPDDGETLAVIIARAGQLPLERVAELVSQVGAALACAHENGIVHGD